MNGMNSYSSSLLLGFLTPRAKSIAAIGGTSGFTMIASASRHSITTGPSEKLFFIYYIIFERVISSDKWMSMYFAFHNYRRESFANDHQIYGRKTFIRIILIIKVIYLGLLFLQ